MATRRALRLEFNAKAQRGKGTKGVSEQFSGSSKPLFSYWRRGTRPAQLPRVFAPLRLRVKNCSESFRGPRRSWPAPRPRAGRDIPKVPLISPEVLERREFHMTISAGHID